VSFFNKYEKSPALAVQIFLIPGINQVGAMSESLGFPVLSGHAHPFRMIAPFIFFSRGTRCIYHKQSRGLLLIDTFVYYIPESTKNGKEKNRGEFTARLKKTS